MASNRCSICLEFNTLISSITETDENNIQHLSKLQSVVPELEWLNDYVICEICIDLLDCTYRFRDICYTLQSQRKDLLKDETFLEDSYFNATEAEAFVTDELNDEKLVTPEELSGNDKFLCENKTEITENENYSCFHCRRKFKAKKNLIHHIDNAHSKSCSDCPQIFLSKKLLKEHIDKMHNKKSLLNEIKVISLQIKKEKEKHVKQNRAKNKFSCEVCGENFGYLKNLLEHCVTVHSMTIGEIKPYSCDICGSRFSSSTTITQHRNYHQGKRPHMCSYCGKSFKTKSDLTVHEYTHFNKRNYKCEACNKGFNTNKNLRTHHLVVHTDSSLWRFVCSICMKRFPLKSNFEQHAKRHMGDKKFKCEICSKLFISRSEMQKHVKYHTNIKGIKCEYCEKEYKEKRSMAHHLAKVHGEGHVKEKRKNFVCHICPHQFSTGQKLSRHLSSHTGLKPFSCMICHKKFADKSYLKYHRKSVHNIVEQISE